VVALTGVTDIVADGARRAAIRNGHPLMGLVTAMGCAGSALLGAALAVEADAWLAAIAALAVLGVAGEIAGANAAGPGSFAVAIIDTLHGLDRATLRARTKVT
jgi:hydroxyethylthiazole kinase